MVASDVEAVGREGSKKPCEWCLERYRCASAGEPLPDGFLTESSFCDIEEADGRLLVVRRVLLLAAWVAMDEVLGGRVAMPAVPPAPR